MKDYIIKEYINKLSINDIITYGKKNNITISIVDANTLLFYAKNYLDIFLHGNPDNLIFELKEKLEPNTFKEAYKLYIINKLKYK